MIEVFFLLYLANILITTGFSYGQDSVYDSEIIDLLDPTNTCPNGISDYPLNIYGATGDLIFDFLPIICGGENQDNEIIYISDLCFTFDSNGFAWIYSGSLKTGRVEAASVAIGANLWVTGGFATKVYEVHKSSRFNVHTGKLEITY